MLVLFYFFMQQAKQLRDDIVKELTNSLGGSAQKLNNAIENNIGAYLKSKYPRNAVVYLDFNCLKDTRHITKEQLFNMVLFRVMHNNTIEECFCRKFKLGLRLRKHQKELITWQRRNKKL